MADEPKDKVIDETQADEATEATEAAGAPNDDQADEAAEASAEETSDDAGGDDAEGDDADSDDAQGDDEGSDEDDSDEDDSDEDASDEDASDADSDDEASDAGGDSGEHDAPPAVVVGPPVENADGMAAFFQHPNEILDAAAVARDQKFERWDVVTPFPIHGMDDAMGIGRSWIPWVTFFAGLAGLTTALSIQIGTMYVDWQIIIGGKPFLPWPSFVPISFELTVLFAGITTALTTFLAAGLPTFKPKIIDPRVTSDRFVLWISADDPQYDSVKTRKFLEDLGPLEVREVRFDS